MMLRLLLAVLAPRLRKSTKLFRPSLVVIIVVKFIGLLLLPDPSGNHTTWRIVIRCTLVIVSQGYVRVMNNACFGFTHSP